MYTAVMTTYLTPDEAAAVLRTTPGSLAARRSRGTSPPYVKDGYRVLYDADELHKWLTDRTIHPTEKDSH